MVLDLILIFFIFFPVVAVEEKNDGGADREDCTDAIAMHKSRRYPYSQLLVGFTFALLFFPLPFVLHFVYSASSRL